MSGVWLAPAGVAPLVGAVLLVAWLLPKSVWDPYTLGKRPARKKGPGVSDEEVRRVSEALDAVERIEDPEARVRAMSKAMADQVKRQPRWKEERRTLVLALRAEGLSYRKIAERVGTSLGTVQDILRGHSGSWRDRPKKSKPDEESST